MNHRIIQLICSNPLIYSWMNQMTTVFMNGWLSWSWVFVQKWKGKLYYCIPYFVTLLKMYIKMLNSKLLFWTFYLILFIISFESFNSFQLFFLFEIFVIFISQSLYLLEIRKGVKLFWKKHYIGLYFFQKPCKTMQPTAQLFKACLSEPMTAAHIYMAAQCVCFMWHCVPVVPTQRSSGGSRGASSCLSPNMYYSSWCHGLMWYRKPLIGWEGRKIFSGKLIKYYQQIC